MEEQASMTPEALIETLALQPHPEGGWYRETWCSPAAAGERAACTAIHFLLKAGERSHWHRVDADEIWCWHAGNGLTLHIEGQGGVLTQRLGPDVIAGEAPQLVVPAGCWQAAEAGDGWALVTCVVAPGFRFEGFELAPPGWSPGGPPDQSTAGR